jgi:hypothetical protein
MLAFLFLPPSTLNFRLAANLTVVFIGFMDIPLPFSKLALGLIDQDASSGTTAK